MNRTARLLVTMTVLAVLSGCGDAGDSEAGKRPESEKSTSRPGTPAGKSSPVKLPAPVMAPKKAREFTHVAGFTFKYPATWTLKKHENFLQLLPSDVKRNSGGATEAYLIVGDDVSTDGITSAADPRVASYLDGRVAQISPTMRRQVAMTAIPTRAGNGVLYTWKGTNLKGEPIEARAYTCIVKTWGIALLALGLEGNVSARSEEVRKIFGTFAFGKGKTDAKVVGRWVLRSTNSLQNDSVWETDWSRAKAVSESRSWLTFNTDGTWSRRDKYHMIAGASGLWVESKDENRSSGSWNAGGGVLFMTWKDRGWDDYKYKVDTRGGGKRLRLVSERKGEIWVPAAGR